MSMCCLVRAVLAADDNYAKMYAIYKACKDAGVSYPPEIIDYFGSAIDNDEVGESGTTKYIKTEPCFDTDRYEEIYSVNLDELPENTKSIEFILA